MDFGFWILDFGLRIAQTRQRPRPVRLPCQIQNPQSKIQNHRPAFTFVELMMGLVITSMVMLALSAVLFAVARGWQGAEMGQSFEMVAAQSSLRLERIVQEAKLTGLVRAGSVDGKGTTAAALMIWKQDGNGDERIQFDEMALIEHNRTQNTLDVYEVRWPDDWTAGQIAIANSEFGHADLTDSTSPEDFKALYYVTRKPLVGGVRGVKFNLIDASAARSAPALEFTLNLERGAALTSNSKIVQAGRQGTVYRSAALRGANFKPVAGYSAFGPTTQPVVFSN